MLPQSDATSMSVERDGRRIAFDVSGAGGGSPVFLLHGMPGSRRGPRPKDPFLYRVGVRLICPDRPGYGDSSRHLGRTVADVAADVAAVADALGLDRFAVAGRSGGGPHALACAALLRERVTRALVMVSVAPPDADDLDWSGGMSRSNAQAYADHLAYVEKLRTGRADQISQNPALLLEELWAEMTPADRRLLGDTGLRRLLTLTYADALRNGPGGWIDDLLALRTSWGFDVREVARPLVLWHGEDDPFSPVSHTQWLAGRISNARVQIEPGAAHFGAMQALVELLPWLAGSARPAHAARPLVGRQPSRTDVDR